MISKGKRWKLALAIAGAAVAMQLAASALVRTHRVRGYLSAHLGRTFGRPVVVDEFTVSLLPSPQLDAAGITVGEDPAFGNEYFLRAERLSAGLRWWGLLRGRFEFGTVTLGRPSLILVRNFEGHWNLERWLPPGPVHPADAANTPGVHAAAETANRLEKIEISDGRLDFKLGDEKQPFAFTDVSGSVEQMAPGRWALRLQAQPWRSGVQLQSAGTLRVQGEVAGTSARLQPAHLRIHWGDASLADLFRLFHGQDSGVRGLFALDATAESGTQSDATEKAGEWIFSLQARTAQIHRWDLTERSDNPRVNLLLRGRWNPSLGTVQADQFAVEAPRSNLRGSAGFLTRPQASFAIHVDSAGIQAADLLAWYRAFQPGVADGVAADQYFTGAMTLSGWPLSLDAAAFSSRGGEVTIPGLPGGVPVGSVRGGMEKRRFVVEPVTFDFGAKTAGETPAGKKAPVALRERLVTSSQSVALSVIHNFETRAGAVTIAGRVERAEDVLKAVGALGKPLNHGWELSGAVRAALLWGWGHPAGPGWNGHIEFSGAQLQTVGLNEPLRLDDARLEWQPGKRSARITQVEGFGASWSGKVSEGGANAAGGGLPWQFDLHADHLDAKELDRWAGPRARPSWLERLMAPLLGGGAPGATPSALLRRLNARGQLRVDEVVLEKISLKHLRAQASLRELQLTLQDVEAQWAGGTVRGTFSAVFGPQPKYQFVTRLDRVNLAQVPLAGRLADRVKGLASGALEMQTEGVGRDTLLQNLKGQGEVRLSSGEFRGWDVAASLAGGSPRAGLSRWTGGDGRFHVANRSFDVNLLRLSAAQSSLVLKGSVSFQREADLTVEAAGTDLHGEKASAASHVMNVAGPLDRPRISLVARAALQPGD